MPKVPTNPHPVGTDIWKEWNTEQWVCERWKKANPPKPKKKYYIPNGRPKGKVPKPKIRPPTLKEKMKRSRDLWDVAVERLAEYGIDSWPLRNRVVVDMSDKVKGYGKVLYEYAGIKGVAEVTGILPDGRRLEICCPVRRTPTDYQAKFIRKINESGGVAFAIWSISELDEQLTKLGFGLRKNRDEDEKEEASERGPGAPGLSVGDAAGSGEQPSQGDQRIPF